MDNSHIQKKSARSGEMLKWPLEIRRNIKHCIEYIKNEDGQKKKKFKTDFGHLEVMNFVNALCCL